MGLKQLKKTSAAATELIDELPKAGKLLVLEHLLEKIRKKDLKELPGKTRARLLKHLGGKDDSDTPKTKPKDKKQPDSKIAPHKRFNFESDKKGASLRVSFVLPEGTRVSDVISEIERRHGIKKAEGWKIAPDAAIPIPNNPVDFEKGETKYSFYIDFNMQCDRDTQRRWLKQRNLNFTDSWIVVLGAALHFDKTKFEGRSLFSGCGIRTTEGVLMDGENGIDMTPARHDNFDGPRVVPAVTAMRRPLDH